MTRPRVSETGGLARTLKMRLKIKGKRERERGREREGARRENE
jgi:hypothetical protein